MTESPAEPSAESPAKHEQPAEYEPPAKRQSRGRHAKPPSAFAVRWKRLTGSRRRRLALGGAGLTAAAALATAVVLTLPDGGGEPASRTAAAETRAGASPSPHEEVDAVGDPDEVTGAVPYFETKDPEKKVVKHVTEVRRSGRFVRVYTDLKEEDENSKPALDLCKWTTQLLKDGGDDEPRVFVHGESADNGSVILANKQSDKDSCEVPDTP